MIRTDTQRKAMFARIGRRVARAMPGDKLGRIGAGDMKIMPPKDGFRILPMPPKKILPPIGIPDMPGLPKLPPYEIPSLPKLPPKRVTPPIGIPDMPRPPFRVLPPDWEPGPGLKLPAYRRIGKPIGGGRRRVRIPVEPRKTELYPGQRKRARDLRIPAKRSRSPRKRFGVTYAETRQRESEEEQQ